MLISPRHVRIYLSVLLREIAQLSESFSGSVMNKGLFRLAFLSAGCFGCRCYLSKQPTHSGIKLQISTVLPNLHNRFELGKMPALKKCTEQTLVTMDIRQKGKSKETDNFPFHYRSASKCNRKQLIPNIPATSR